MNFSQGGFSTLNSTSSFQISLYAARLELGGRTELPAVSKHLINFSDKSVPLHSFHYSAHSQQ